MARTGVPLFQQFVEDLGDPVVDHVTEPGQELFVGGRAGGWHPMRSLLDFLEDLLQ